MGTLIWGAGAAAVWVAAQISGAILYLVLWHEFYPDQPVALSAIASHGPALAFSVLFAAPFVLGYMALAVRAAKMPFRDYLALKWPGRRDVVRTLVGLAGLLAFFAALNAIAGKDMPSFVSESFLSARDAGMLPLLIIGFAVMAPLQEEIIFRGFLYRGFCEKFGALATVLFTSVAFALLHAQYEWYFVAQVFALGFFFGWVRWKSGSTLLPILLHGALNAIAIVEAYFATLA
jgi:membrane protease YdiL (CAAX protease family)